MKYSNKKTINWSSILRWLIPATLVAVVAVGLSIPIFYEQAFHRNRFYNDIPMHVDLTIVASLTGQWPEYTVYHRLIYWLSMGTATVTGLGYASVGLLSLFTLFRAEIIFFILLRKLKGIHGRILIAIGLAVALLLAMPVFNWWKFPSVYLGQFAPSNWHNPTTILSMPLALLLFYISIRLIETSSWKHALFAGLFLLSTGLMKPNYPMAFLPAFWMIFLFEKRHDGRTTILKTTGILTFITAPLAAMLAYQYYATFVTGVASESGIAIIPLVVWRKLTPNIPASLLLSLAFPATFAVLYPRQALSDKHIRYAWVVLAVAILQFMFLVQTGDKMFDGNFIWGGHIALFVLFVTTCGGLFRQGRSWRFYTTLSVLALHLVGGATFYWRALTLDILTYHASLLFPPS